MTSGPLQRQYYGHLAKPIGAFCHAVRAGEWLYVSGLTARDTPAAQGDILVQTEAICEALRGVLEAEGGGFADVVRVTVYVTELDRLAEVHEVRTRYFGEPPPASTLVQVSSLVRPELKIEIEAIARIPG